MLKGKAWKFGDDISTDLIAPGRYYHLRSNLPELAKHVLEDARKEFAGSMNKGDFIVAGKNFGLGSSREHAAIIIKLAGVSAVLAKSFARIFYRNAINVGLPVIICDTDKINERDELEVDLSKGIIKNLTSGETLTFPPLPDIMTEILKEGGVVSYLQKYGDFKI
ncbi:3-isopropylmalate dehydratase small subunit [Candidatus Aminicenantes bacterium AC-708-M15]|jgi:3-isopropylmalate/(R)-2-methylmalate dehydratase small subunit|nr:3-isopropylmalate dehydratase small subunit [SCandidatus Aminicenantes bacterium Aminicenantia_JdfR_composite]MCP2596655.1 3-isopropylmalate dehydratase small subunit [Candidatus Aminicenantes bacterium AC-335-G13]MCP2598226.1 3-isopropylmalate dehydratase small subunit [Candidatus Aminicenantes bacterium AC-335-L06]MCP2603941.1 3-isopropylmalate dehydratase small subunit [Candidatus Aminicenantes bacterium AC-708-M15]MCP2606352.1 3-isopropylmalate dehydratase small subunit [Candidatus Amini